MNGTIVSPFKNAAQAFAAVANSSAFKRADCLCCARPRLTCWHDPCPQLVGLARDIRDPKTVERVTQWCAEGGFELHRGDNGNLIARPWFYVGDGARYTFNGDAYPVTVVGVSKNGMRVTVRRDRSRYGLFIVDPNGKLMTFTRRQDGAYRSSKCGTWTLYLGRATERNREL